MIKIRLYDYDRKQVIEVFTKLRARDFWLKNCRIYCDKNGINHGKLFLCWSSKKRNYNCWHYSIGNNR